MFCIQEPVCSLMLMYQTALLTKPSCVFLRLALHTSLGQDTRSLPSTSIESYPFGRLISNTVFSEKPTLSLLPGGDHSPFFPNFSTPPIFQAVRLVFIHCFMVMVCRLNSFICFMYSVVTYLKNRLAWVFFITVFFFL